MRRLTIKIIKRTAKCALALLMLCGIMTSTNQQNMYALASSGTRRTKRARKLGKHKLPLHKWHKRHRAKRAKRRARRKFTPSKTVRIHLDKVEHKKPKRYSKRLHRRMTAYQKKEASAKHQIAYMESRGRWNVSNGRCYGKYQLDVRYLHGDYSHANQEKTANRYTRARYGSWQSALAFHYMHGWY